MSIDWFRSWHGAPTDNKWLAIAKRANVPAGMVSAIVWALFDCASQATERGDISAFDPESYAAFSGFDEQKVVDVLKALDEKEITTGRRFKSWERRQPKKEDNGAAERKRKQREQENVTQCHTMSHNVTTDKEKSREDKKVSKNPPSPPRGEIGLPDWIPEKPWQDFKAHRGKGFGYRAQLLAIAKLDRWRMQGHDPTEILNNSIMNGWKGLFEPQGKPNETTIRNQTKPDRAKAAADRGLAIALARHAQPAKDHPALLAAPAEL